ncbi:FAD-binding domain-containing protein [Coniophora puteana RWD-64-598 SS2]|uniref:FAD-binding domain-containing protein n=1 Tax=Coniophora puteana (strain RWD-64-598) TaxID=741705 RepID=R7SFV3_CONPW|nr:FAD-binding domain-containing protein [Coniophora puteana RWD-64-598 SS2]EIW73969.1 FAD-binding domain-containing protein [Coniophora puteana RWD-64-598 SS2]
MKPIVSALAAALFSSLLLPSFAVPQAQSRCRCTYDQPCWPSAAAFAALQTELSQPLLHPVPTAAQCYPSFYPSLSPAAAAQAAAQNCAGVVANYTDSRWRAGQPGSMQAPNWEAHVLGNGSIAACFADTGIEGWCAQGGVPVRAVDARTVRDVQAAVRFAGEHGLRMVVKNTGHDYVGRSAGAGALMVWTHHMKNISYDAAFVPEGGSANETLFYSAFTFSAGVQWFEAYAAAKAKGRLIVGGLSAGGSVGAAGGWIQGGGHSALSSTYGLGVDNAIQMTVVTANGTYLTVNKHQNSDLFWALRGGGGGTFGVVTSVTYRTYPSVPVVAAFFNVTSPTANRTLIQDLLTESYSMLPALADAGWGGYGHVANDTLQFFYMSPRASWAEANATWAPLFERVYNLSAAGALHVGGAFTVAHDDFYALYEQAFPDAEGENGGNVIMGSRLIPREVVERNNTEIARAVFDTPGMTWNFVAGGQVAKADPDSAAVNPAWRKALVHIVWLAAWEDGTSSEDLTRLAELVGAQSRAMAALTPGSGSYFNEASPFEDDFETTFFGRHYERLKAIKDEVDPGRLFVVRQGVGSEEWDGQLLCRV